MEGDPFLSDGLDFIPESAHTPAPIARKQELRVLVSIPLRLERNHSWLSASTGSRKREVCPASVELFAEHAFQRLESRQR